MFAVCISGKRSKCYLMCISQKHPGNPLCVSQKYKESNSFPFLDANKQNNYIMFFLCFCGKQSTCFPNVFQANTDFTCFPSLFSWKTVTIPSSVKHATTPDAHGACLASPLAITFAVLVASVVCCFRWVETS